MNQDDKRQKTGSWRGWLSELTRLPEFVDQLFESRSSGVRAWARTTSGIVAMLVAVQIMTGVLLAFYFVPSVDAAFTTVVYIEKVLPAGAWIRSLHHYGSQWLTLFLVLHLAQMFWRASYRQRPVAWLAAVFLLALVLAGGVTGYSLPWDARAFFGTRVAEGIAAGIPLVGGALQRWLLGGTEISTMTLSRFFGLHVLAVPAFLLVVIASRLFILREPGPGELAESPSGDRWKREQFARQSIAAGLVFLALALFALKYHAPLGPSASDASPGYLPRPGVQFLWLFQMLKYVPGRFASLLAVLVPKLIFIGLVLLPFLDARRRRKHPKGLHSRKISIGLFACGLVFITLMTVMSYVNDRRDPNTRAQLLQQAQEEAAFRAEPFTPLPPRSSGISSATPNSGGTSTSKVVNAETPPESYLKRCSSCHGIRGQGAKSFPSLLGVSTKPRRTVEDIVGLLNDPASYGLEPPMRSFATKLTDNEKREIAEWVMVLKK